MSSLDRDPTDVLLVVEMSRPQIVSWLSRLVDDMPDSLVPPGRDVAALEKALAPLYDEMREGDSLWLGQSRARAPEHAHVGIALVRDGQPAAYIRMVGP